MQVTRFLRITFLSSLLVGLVVFLFHGQTGATASVNFSSLRYGHTLTGNIQMHKGFHSKFLPTTRDLSVYLPPGYESGTARRYPVLYMQDGQNLFDAATSFFNGREVRMDEEAQRLIAQREVEPIIIVGISSSGLARVNEFTPAVDGPKQGGKADLYGRMLVEEIKPFIDSQYRTLKDRSHTGLGGTSLGGLATLYLGLKYKKVFGKLAVVSPAAFWNDQMIVKYVESLPSRTHQRICISIGTAEPDGFLTPTRALRQALMKKGWREGFDLGYLEVEGAQHGPDEHNVRVDHMLRFISPRLTKSSNKTGKARGINFGV